MITLFLHNIGLYEPFNDDSIENPNYYKGSNLESLLKQFLTNTDRKSMPIFIPAEKDSFVNRTLEGGADLADKQSRHEKIHGDSVDALIWPLSWLEVSQVSPKLRKVGGSDQRIIWWLRTASNFVGNVRVNIVDQDMYCGDGYPDTDIAGHVTQKYGVRPAFNLKLSTILFTSSATGSKSAKGLQKVESNTDDNWKLTIKDKNRSKFKADACRLSNGKIEIHYSGAKTGKGESLSAAIVNSDHIVDYYGSLAQLTNKSDAAGKVTVNINDKLNEDDTFYVFNEQRNGDKKTDPSSKLVKITPGHNLKITKAKKASCTKNGNKTYYTCSKCGRYFSDSKAKNEIKNNSWILKAFGHKWGAWKVTRVATAAKAGEKKRICKNDSSHVQKKSIPKPGIILPKIVSSGSNGLKLTWNKVRGAQGYDIFFVICGKTTPKKVKSYKGNKTLSWTKKGLKEKTAYKAVVKAYVMHNGKKIYVRNSLMVHAYTSGGTKNYTNARSVTAEKTAVSIKKNKTCKIEAVVNKLQEGKKLMPTLHAPRLRYISSNTNIATVSKSGNITAKSKGECKDYAIAVNGSRKAVTVTVK